MSIKHKHATMADVARLAQVNKATVSRVLNGYSMVSPSTRDRVLEAIRVLEFIPDKSAQSLARGARRVIGFVYADQPMGEIVFNPFFSRILQGITTELSESGYNILLITTAASDYSSLENVLRSRSVDGLIINSSSGDTELYSILQKFSMPSVTVGAPGVDGPFSSVRSDDEAGGYEATHFLLKSGHRNLRFVAGTVRGKLLLHNEHRINGFKRALADFGLNDDGSSVIRSPVSQQARWDEIPELAYRQGVDGLIISNEVMAMSLLNLFLQREDFTVPRDISLITFGDESYYKFMRPHFTTIHSDVLEMGSDAAKILIGLIGGVTQDEIPLQPVELRVGDTTRRRDQL